MIYLGVSITNPYSSKFENLFCKEYLYKPYKAIEVELTKDTALIRFSFSWTFRSDHAGISIEFGLLGYSISVNTHDTRHWDAVTDTWAVYED